MQRQWSAICLPCPRSYRRRTRRHELASWPSRARAWRGVTVTRQHRNHSEAPALVAAGNPVVLVDNTNDARVVLPRGLEDASTATSERITLGFALTRLGGTGVPTWYLGPNAGANADWDMRRKLRICLLRLHAEEEVLDRVVSWIDGGSPTTLPGPTPQIASISTSTEPPRSLSESSATGCRRLRSGRRTTPSPK